jgi:hypothetical protein
MESDEIKLMNILPCSVGEEFIKTANSIGIDDKRANIILSSLVDRGLVGINDGGYFITEKGQELLFREGVESRSAVDSIKLKKITSDVLSKAVWESKKIKLHPAMDFIDKAYTTTFIIFEEDNNLEVEKPVIITSERECIPVDKLPEIFSLEEQPMKTESWIERGKLSKYPSLEVLRKFLSKDEINIDLKKVYEQVCGKLKFFIDFEDSRYYSFVSLWIIGTYFHQLFSAYPYLYINATKRSGKTKLLTTIGFMSFNPETFIAPSSASFYRIIQAEKCTLLIDEIEKLPKKEASDIRGIILSGYKKGFSVPRIEEVRESRGEKKFKTVKYDTYSPKAMANISGIEEVIADRCVSIILTRSLNKSILNRDPRTYSVDFQPIRDSLFLCQMLLWEKIKKSYEMFGDLLSENAKISDFDSLKKLKENVSSRHWELWQPILAIANCINRNIVDEMVSLAIDMTKEKEEEEEVESFDTSLIRVLCGIVDKTDWYAVSHIAKELRIGEEFEKITSEQVSRALSRLKLIYSRKEMNRRRNVLIKLEKLKECAKKFNMDYDELRMEQGLSSSLSKKDRLLKLVDDLTDKFGGYIDLDTFLIEAKGVFSDEEELKKNLDKLHNEGIIYYPKPNMISLVKHYQKKLNDINLNT